jgi:5'(3')-deoxyribonucleotidase
MSTKRKTIAIDMDGVIADTVSHFISCYKNEYGVQIEKEAFRGKPESEVLPDGAVRKFVHKEGFFRGIPVMEGAVEAVKELMKYFDVYIASAAMEFPQSLKEKYEWLQEHFPFISWRNIIFCGDKSIIDTDYMIDDYARNLDGCKGKTLLFTAGHNIDESRHTRVDNWKQIIELLEKEREDVV